MDEDAEGVIVSLISSDDAIVATLRSVIERGWEDRLTRGLDRFCTLKENELSNMCNLRFDEFSTNLANIRKLYETSTGLRKELRAMATQLQEKGANMQRVSTELSKNMRIKNNLAVAKSEITMVSSLVQLVKAARLHIENRQYLQALQVVDLLRSVIHGDNIEKLQDSENRAQSENIQERQMQSDGFVHKLRKLIQDIEEVVKRNVTSEMKDWLVESRDAASKIGAKSLEVIENIQKHYVEGLLNLNTEEIKMNNIASTILRPKKAPTLKSYPSSEIVIAWETSEVEHSRDIAKRILTEELNAMPIHQFLSIYSLLGNPNAALEYYKSNRIPQLTVQTMIQIDINKLNKGKFVEHCRELFEKIVGYFVAEMKLSSEFGFISPQELGSLWDAMLDVVVPLLEAHLSDSTQARDKLEIIQLVLVVCQVMSLHEHGGYSILTPVPLSTTSKYTRSRRQHEAIQNIHLDTAPLILICKTEARNIHDLFVEMTLHDLEKILDEDTMTPLHIQNAHDPRYAFIVKYHLLGASVDGNAGAEIFPRKFRFSESIIKILSLFSGLIDKSFTLTRLLSSATSDTGKCTSYKECARSTMVLVDELVLKINENFSIKIADPGISPGVLCQLAINAWSLQQAFQVCETYIKSLGSLLKDSQREQTWRLESLSLLGFTYEKAQNGLFELITEKINDLLSTATTVDWTPQQDPGQPHWFIMDIIQYLQIQFGEDSILQLLPEAKLQALLILVCRHIADSMLDLICGSKIASINPISVYILSLDIDELRKFARTSAVPDCVHCLDGFYQTISVLQEGDLEGFLVENTRNKKYYSVDRKHLKNLLSKYKQLGIGTRMFSSSASSSNITVIKHSEITKVMSKI